MSTSALATIEAITAVEFFKPGASTSILEGLKIEVRAITATLDGSIPADREVMRSLAAKLGKTKNKIDGSGKELVAGEKARLKIIDTERSTVWDEMEALQHEVRKPLTDWEQAEDGRVSAHELALKEIAELSNPPFGSPSEEIRRRSDAVDALSSRDWEEFQRRFELAHSSATHVLAKLWQQTEQAEKDKAEFERMKAEQIVREQAEREAAMKAEAASKAKAEAEVEAQRKAQETAASEAREREAVERQRVAAEERAAAAEREAERVLAQAARDKAEAEQREIARAAEAEEAQKRAATQAAAEQVQAVERERARAAEEKRLAEEAEAKREANKKHCAKINRLAVVALMEGVPELTEDQARTVVTIVAKGTVPAMRITY